MAYNLIAEFSWEPRWDKLQRVAAPLTAVHCFPIPQDEMGGAALGISLPQQAVDRHAWSELERLLLAVWDEPGARVFDLYTAAELRPETRAELKASLLGKA